MQLDNKRFMNAGVRSQARQALSGRYVRSGAHLGVSHKGYRLALSVRARVIDATFIPIVYVSRCENASEGARTQSSIWQRERVEIGS